MHRRDFLALMIRSAGVAAAALAYGCSSGGSGVAPQSDWREDRTADDPAPEEEFPEEETAEDPERKVTKQKWTYTGNNGAKYDVEISYNSKTPKTQDPAGATSHVKGIHALALSRWSNTSCDNLTNTIAALKPAHFAIACVPFWNPSHPFAQIKRVLKNINSSTPVYLTLFAGYHSPNDPQGISVRNNARGIAGFMANDLPNYPNVTPIISPALEDQYNSRASTLQGYADLVFGLYEGFNNAPALTSLHIRRNTIKWKDSFPGVLTATVTPKKPASGELTWNVALNIQKEYHLSFHTSKSELAYSNDGQFVYDAATESYKQTPSNAAAKPISSWKNNSGSHTLFYMLWRPKYNLWERALVKSGKDKGKYKYVDPRTKYPPVFVWGRSDFAQTAEDELAFGPQEARVLTMFLS